MLDQTTEQEVLQQFKVFSIPALIDALCHYRKKSEYRPEKAITVSLLCRSGDQFTGEILDNNRSDGDREAATLLFRSKDANSDGFSLLFLEYASVCGIRILEPVKHAQFLSNNQIARNPYEEAPTALELKRELEEKLQSLCSKLDHPIELVVNWDDVFQDTVSTLNFRDLSLSFLEFLDDFVTDELNKKEIKHISELHIEHRDGAELEGLVDGQRFCIAVDFERALPDGLKQHLQQGLSDAL